MLDLRISYPELMLRAESWGGGQTLCVTRQAWPVNSMSLLGDRQNRVIAIFKMHTGGGEPDISREV